MLSTSMMLGLMQNGYIFNPKSPEAAALSHLFVVVLIVTAVIFTIVAGLVIYVTIRFRARPGAPEPRQVSGHRGLEIAWTVVPLLLLAWILVLTVGTMKRADPAGDAKPDLVVIGHQWWWEVRYPKSGVVTANEIHVPVGKRLRVRLKSADVVHDFWVPQLARKMDMVPGHPNDIWLEADVPGTYPGACYEFCGAEHAWMRFQLVAESPAAYAAWIKQQAKPAAIPTDPEALKGFELFEKDTCANCHSIRGASAGATFGPDLTHLASRAYLGAGILSNTPAHLARWLHDPQAVKPGCLMPNFNLSQAQIHELVQFLTALK